MNRLLSGATSATALIAAGVVSMTLAPTPSKAQGPDRAFSCDVIEKHGSGPNTIHVDEIFWTSIPKASLSTEEVFRQYKEWVKATKPSNFYASRCLELTDEYYLSPGETPDDWRNEYLDNHRNTSSGAKYLNGYAGTFTPVPGSPSSSKRHTTRLYWPDAQRGRTGYQSASIGFNYLFLSCDDEIHMAYAIDPKSVRSDGWYWPVGSTTAQPHDDAIVPEPPAVTLRGRVTVSNVMLNPGSTVWSERIYDEFAGPSLGFGCLTGQTKSIGKTAKLVGPKPKPEQIQAFLDALVFAGEVGDGPLEFARLDPKAGKTIDPRAEVAADLERARAEREARWQAKLDAYADAKAKHDKQVADSEAAQRAYRDELARLAELDRQAKARQAEYERQKAANDAARAKAEADRAAYERQMEQYRRDNGGG